MTADQHGHRQVLAELLGAARVRPQMAAAVQAGPEQVRTLELHAMEARVADARIGVFRHYDAVGDVGAAVLRKVARYRQGLSVKLRAGVDAVEGPGLRSP